MQRYVYSPDKKQTRRAGALVLATCVFSCAGCSQIPKLQPSRPELQARSFDRQLPPTEFDRTGTAGNSRVASSAESRGLVARPKPFEWAAVGSSAGQRDIQAVTIGNGGYRTLILGSLAGDDPLAISLTEQLAQHIHENNIILGGIVATVVRNANPDGAAAFRMENGNGVYLNRQFPDSGEISLDRLSRQPEIRFILGVLEDQQPQRVIHIRSTSRNTGRIAASRGASRVARDACDWLDFEFLELPGSSAEGTLERLLAKRETSEIITIAIPQSSTKSELWELYGDAILNMLLDEDYETRKLARSKKARELADRRTRNSGVDSPRDD